VSTSIGIGSVPDWISVSASYNNGDINASFSVFSIFHIGANVDMSAGYAAFGTSLDLSVFDLGISVGFSVFIGFGNAPYTIDLGGFSATFPPTLGFSATATATAHLVVTDPSISLSVQSDPLNVCGSFSVIGTFCVPRDL
jgi:hypothetical protein